MTYEYDREEAYRQQIEYETLLNQQIGRIAQFRSNKQWEEYEESIETLILMLPAKLREDANKFKEENKIEYDLSLAGRKRYDNLWRFCNRIMEESNLSFKTRYIKTYR